MKFACFLALIFVDFSNSPLSNIHFESVQILSIRSIAET